MSTLLVCYPKLYYISASPNTRTEVKANGSPLVRSISDNYNSLVLL